MKKVLFIIILISGFAMNAQKTKAKVFVNKVLTSTERDTYVVPSGEVWKIYNTTTSQYETNIEGAGWVADTGGGTYTAGNAIDITGSVISVGSESITTNEMDEASVLSSEIGDDSILEIDLNAINTPTDEYVLTYETTGADFEWVAPTTLGTDDQTAAEVTNTPSGNLVATNVQTALDELQTEVDGISGGSESTTVSDTAEIDLTLSGTDISGVLIAGSIDETKLDTSTNDKLNLAGTALQPNTTVTSLNLVDSDGVGYGLDVVGNSVNMTGGTTGAGSRVQFIVDDNSLRVTGLTNTEIDAVGATAIPTTSWVEAEIAASESTPTHIKVANFTALRAISSTTTGDIAEVTESGARNGKFIYDATLSATDDDGVVVAGWVRQYTGDVNFLWFGGVNTWDIATQGSSTDSGVLAAYNNEAQWVNANTYTSSVKGTLYFPSGTYMFDVSDGTDVDLYSYVTYQGEKNKTIFTIPAIVDGSNMWLYANSVSNFTIKDIILDGNRDNVDGDDTDGVGNLRLRDCSYVHLENLTSQNTWYLAMSLINSHHLVIKNYNTNNTDCGIITQDASSVITDVLIDGGIIDGGNASEGIILYQGDHKNITIQNMTIRNKPLGTGIAVGRVGEPTATHDNINILYNTISNMAGGISFADGINTNSSIVGNIVTDLAAGAGIGVTKSYDLTVIGNKVNGVPQDAYHIVDSERVIFTNNFGINPASDYVTFSNGYGYFNIEGSSHVTMSTNKFYTDHATVQKSGKITNSSYVDFRNNKLYTTNGAPNQTVYVNTSSTINADAVTDSYIEANYPLFTLWDEHATLYDGTVDNTNIHADRGSRIRNITFSGGDGQLAQHITAYNNYETTITDGSLENLANKKTGQEVNLRVAITTTPLVLTNSGNIVFSDTATIPTGETVQFRFISEGSTWREISRSYNNSGSSTDDQTAAEVTYDNTTSGLTADNVKDAIDELEDEIDGVSAISTETQNKIDGNIVRVPYTTEDFTVTVANQRVQSGADIGSIVWNDVQGATTAKAALVSLDATKIDKFHFNVTHASGRWDITSAGGFVIDGLTTEDIISVIGIGAATFVETGINTGEFEVLAGTNVNLVASAYSPNNLYTEASGVNADNNTASIGSWLDADDDTIGMTIADDAPVVAGGSTRSLVFTRDSDNFQRIVYAYTGLSTSTDYTIKFYHKRTTGTATGMQMDVTNATTSDGVAVINTGATGTWSGTAFEYDFRPSTGSGDIRIYPDYNVGSVNNTVMAITNFEIIAN